ncbi:hypothetical protein EYC84_001803 [Monilinia fructicola]|uniref:Uncharacterized protein n=1 Tax=Monilinia fructicola TaxID=38448 RepID=A0A5M9JUQ3_MONFR|nr:hypothetical protein EYC84_001803 [Monilinia fructicola]
MNVNSDDQNLPRSNHDSGLDDITQYQTSGIYWCRRLSPCPLKYSSKLPTPPKLAVFHGYVYFFSAANLAASSSTSGIVPPTGPLL